MGFGFEFGICVWGWSLQGICIQNTQPRLTQGHASNIGRLDPVEGISGRLSLNSIAQGHKQDLLS